MFSPAFQIYPAEVLADHRIAALTPPEFGAYMRLQLQAWLLDNTLPNDIHELALIARMEQGEFEAIWLSTIGKLFNLDKKRGTYFCPHLSAQIKQQKVNRKAKSEAGKLGAFKRYGANKLNNTAITEKSSAMASNGFHLINSSSGSNDLDLIDVLSPSSSSSSSDKVTDDDADKIRVIKGIYEKYAPHRPWNEADMKAAKAYTKTDPRLLEMAILKGQLNKFNSDPELKINSFKYYAAEIEFLIGENYLDSEIDELLRHYRTTWWSEINVNSGR